MKNNELCYPVSIVDIVAALRLFSKKTDNDYERLIMTEAADRLELTRDIRPEPAKVKPRKVKRAAPLTLEELRQMDGEPVWIKADHYGVYADVVQVAGKDEGEARVRFQINWHLQENGHDKTWLAYRSKPKEG